LSHAETTLGFTQEEWSLIREATSMQLVLAGAPAALHVPVSLLLSARISKLASQFGVDTREQGLGLRDVPLGAGIGALASVAVWTAVLGGALVGRLHPLYTEPGIQQTPWTRALYEVLFRIPTGTALAEEIVFRGAILGLLSRKHPHLTAAVVNALLFGAWHVWPSLKQAMLASEGRDRSPQHLGAILAPPLVFTCAAGLVLSALRYRSRSIIAPWFVHASANSAGYSAIWLAARRRKKASGLRAA
jgi:membrane protease YdiL (CAAX protease family)